MKPQEIRFRDAKTTSETYRLEITYDIIESAIITMLNKLKITEEEYNNYLEHMNEELGEINEENKAKLNTLALQMNKIKSDKTAYIKQYMGKLNRKEEMEIYDKELVKYDNRIHFLEQEINILNSIERDTILEFQTLVGIL